MTQAPIEIVAYDGRWPVLFQAESALLSSLLAPWLCGPLEPIGSTAVPGPCAKPVIDIMAPVRALGEAHGAIEVLESAG